eukprot:5038451-Pleurochrysis_carterae.AAC.1
MCVGFPRLAPGDGAAKAWLPLSLMCARQQEEQPQCALQTSQMVKRLGLRALVPVIENVKDIVELQLL